MGGSNVALEKQRGLRRKNLSPWLQIKTYHSIINPNRMEIAKSKKKKIYFSQNLQLRINKKK